MRISRHIAEEGMFSIPVPNGLEITSGEWQQVFNQHDNLVSRYEYFGKPELLERPNDMVLLGFNGERIAIIELYEQGYLSINYQKRNFELIFLLAELANRLDAKLLVNHFQEISPSEISRAKEKIMQRVKKSKKVYQKDSFGGSNLWLAIKGDLTQVLEYFQLEGQEKPWAEALLNMHSCEGIFAYSFRGWTFLAGMDVGELLAPYPEGEQAIEQHHVDKLLEWGKEFADVQMYYYYNRVEYMNAYYRVLNGQVVYGSYYTETYQNTHGKIPSNIKNLSSDDASTIASEWSFDPDYLRYCKELAGATAWVVSSSSKD